MRDRSPLLLLLLLLLAPPVRGGDVAVMTNEDMDDPVAGCGGSTSPVPCVLSAAANTTRAWPNWELVVLPPASSSSSNASSSSSSSSSPLGVEVVSAPDAAHGGAAQGYPPRYKGYRYAVLGSGGDAARNGDGGTAHLRLRAAVDGGAGAHLRQPLVWRGFWALVGPGCAALASDAAQYPGFRFFVDYYDPTSGASASVQRVEAPVETVGALPSTGGFSSARRFVVHFLGAPDGATAYNLTVERAVGAFGGRASPRLGGPSGAAAEAEGAAGNTPPVPAGCALALTETSFEFGPVHSSLVVSDCVAPDPRRGSSDSSSDSSRRKKGGGSGVRLTQDCDVFVGTTPPGERVTGHFAFGAGDRAWATYLSGVEFFGCPTFDGSLEFRLSEYAARQILRESGQELGPGVTATGAFPIMSWNCTFPPPGYTSAGEFREHTLVMTEDIREPDTCQMPQATLAPRYNGDSLEMVVTVTDDGESESPACGPDPSEEPFPVGLVVGIGAGVLAVAGAAAAFLVVRRRSRQNSTPAPPADDLDTGAGGGGGGGGARPASIAAPDDDAGDDGAATTAHLSSTDYGSVAAGSPGSRATLTGDYDSTPPGVSPFAIVTPEYGDMPANDEGHRDEYGAIDAPSGPETTGSSAPMTPDLTEYGGLNSAALSAAAESRE